LVEKFRKATVQTRKKSFARDFGHFWKVIHKMLSVKIAKLFEEHVYVFFCQMPKTKARSGPFQKGAIRQAHGPEQSRRTYVRSNPDFIGTVNV
jgi:hypothetical protein